MTDRAASQRKKSTSSGPTIRDVAKLAGVSTGTVSRVITARTVVSDTLKHNVLRAVDQLGYYPNSAARNLRSRSTGFIGFLVPELHGAIHAMYVSSAELAVRKAGYNLVVGTTGNDKFREKELLRFLMDGRIDGAAILIGEESQPDLRKFLRNLRVPVAIIERNAPAGVDTVQVDHRAATRRAVDYLVSLGHKRIALLTAAPHIRTTIERRAGIEAALQGAKLPVDSLLLSTDCESDEAAYAVTSQMLSRPDRPTAFMVIAKGLAGTLRALNKHEMRFPRDASILCLGHSDLCTLVEPGITALGWDHADVGRSAIELVLSRLNAEAPRPERHILMTSELVIRSSCGRPPHDIGP
jgi:LacI family transcriptional regulator